MSGGANLKDTLVKGVKNSIPLYISSLHRKNYVEKLT